MTIRTVGNLNDSANVLGRVFVTASEATRHRIEDDEDWSFGERPETLGEVDHVARSEQVNGLRQELDAKITLRLVVQLPRFGALFQPATTLGGHVYDGAGLHLTP